MRSLSTLRSIGVTVALVLCASGAEAQAREPEDIEFEFEVEAAEGPAVEPDDPDDDAESAAVEAEVDPDPDEAESDEAVLAESLQAELATLRARLAALEASAATPSDVASEPAPSTEPNGVDAGPGLFRTAGDLSLRLSGYVQLQYQHDQLSRDELVPGGVFLNQDGFVVRRGRVRLLGSWKMLQVGLEIDGSTTRGPFVGVRRAFVRVRFPFDDLDTEPLVALTAGLTTIPFGFEVRRPNEERLFMERTTGSLAFFRGPVDVGARVHGRLGPFEYDLGAFNGTPLDDRAGAPGVDPTAAVDLIGRLGVVGKPSSTLRVGGGVSYLYGTGFHAGEDAGKDRVEWQDLNENGRLDNGELVPIPGRAALPSETFERWAVGADARLEVRTRLGWTRVWVEAVLASNLDRSFFVADPFITGQDVRELAVWAGITQQITEYGVVGFRYDYYDPNADLLDDQRGRRVPQDASIQTFSPLVAVTLPNRARLIFQYDAVLDSLARDVRGVPADLANDRWTIRLQGSY